MSEPTVTQRAKLQEIELKREDVVAFGPRERVFCSAVGAFTVAGRIAPCTDHLAQHRDCVPCYDSGKEHAPCPKCR
jgi:hypothetical protein